MAVKTGPLGVSTGDIPLLAQALGELLVQGGYTREQVVWRLTQNPDFDVWAWWEARKSKVLIEFEADLGLNGVTSLRSVF
jgi:hypothetical protein